MILVTLDNKIVVSQCVYLKYVLNPYQKGYTESCKDCLSAFYNKNSPTKHGGASTSKKHKFSSFLNLPHKFTVDMLSS